jgi:WD40 repeat protein
MLPRRLSAVLFAGLALALTPPGSGRTAEPSAKTDLHGDPLPPGAIARLGTVRWRPRHGGISQMAFVPGGPYLATAGGLALSVWDADTGRLVRTISTDGTPLGEGFDCFALTPDGKRILSADQPGGLEARMTLWDFSTGKVLMQAKSDLGGGVLRCLAVRPDGRVAACATHLGDVFLWDLGKNEVRRVVTGDRRTTIHRLSFAGEGKHLVVLPSEGGVSQRIDVASGEVLKRVELGSCGRVALAPGTGTVAAYSYPDRLELYDTLTGEKRRLPLPEKVNFLDLSFSPDGRTLLAMDRDAEVVQFWDAAKGQLLRKVQVPGLALTHQHAELQLSGDGERLASHEEYHVVRIWDARTGRPQLPPPGHVFPPTQLTFSADGKEAVSLAYRNGSRGGCELHRWDVTTGKLLARFLPNAREDGWPGRDDGWLLAPGGRHLAERAGGSLRLYEVSTASRFVLADKVLAGSDWTFSSDGRTLVTVGEDRDIRLWDVASGKLLRRLEPEKKGKPVSWLRLTPDGRTLATGEGWEKVRLWDAATGKHLATLRLPAEREPFQKPLYDWQTAFTPDGRYLFASNTTNLWVWDVVARREIGPFEEDEHEWRLAASGRVAVSPDGRLMAWFDPARQLCLYEVCTGKIVYRLKGSYSSIAFTPSGWRLATSCNADSSVLIWDLPFLFRSQPPPGQDNSPEALWVLLKSDDAARAQRALWRLAALPEADAFLARHLRPVEGMPPQRLRTLLTDLGSTDFDRRQRAEEALAEAGEAARAALTEEFARTEDLEVKRRLAGLQERLQPRAPERLREIRAVLALEARGTPEARRLLQRLAAGLPDARLTQEAKNATERLPN